MIYNISVYESNDNQDAAEILAYALAEDAQSIFSMCEAHRVEL